MKHLYLCMAFLLCGCFLLSGCTSTDPMPSNVPTPTSEIVVPTSSPQILVETGVEYHLDDGERCRVDVRLPKISREYPNADKLNEVIEAEFYYPTIQTEISDWETAEGYEYTWHQYDYSVTEFDGVYSISVFNTISSAYGSYQPWQWVWSIYYDANEGNILTAEQFLKEVGYTEDEIVSAYTSAYCPARKPEEIDFDKILFYFDECRQPKFIFNSMAFTGRKS